MDNEMDRKEIKQQRNVRKLKKKIDKLMHLGGLTEQQKAIVRSTSNLARNLLGSFSPKTFQQTQNSLPNMQHFVRSSIKK